MKYESTLAFARSADRSDPLRKFRGRFRFPNRNGKQAVYLLGNSLGLQSRSVKAALTDELETWAQHGVEGFFTGRKPWMKHHELTRKTLARLTGAREQEVIAMNQLTVNIHLMMASFYRPAGKRNRILMEAGSFPSDRYAVDSHIRWHGLDPADVLVEVAPEPGQYTLSTERITEAIRTEGDRLALVLIGAVQYYTGQFFNIGAITRAGHEAGAQVGFDLAHAIGNVPLQLHKDGPDFAVWCGYKYLNSGPGGLAGIFVHERHGRNHDLPRLTGWWGRDPNARFMVGSGFLPAEGAAGWQLSTYSVLPGAVQRAALSLFDEAGFKALRRKSINLTGYLEFLLKQHSLYGKVFSVITPEDPDSRGCQLSIHLPEKGKEVFQRLSRQGIMADWRDPAVIRFAPVPMYNSFVDVHTAAGVFLRAVDQIFS